MQHNRRSDVDVVHFFDFIGAGTIGCPTQTNRSNLRWLGQHLDLVRHHKRRIETHAKLSDYIWRIFRRRAAVFQLFEKLFRSRSGNCSQIIDKLLFCHSNASILLYNTNEIHYLFEVQMKLHEKIIFTRIVNAEACLFVSKWISSARSICT